MIGNIDEWSRDSLHGWAWDPGCPGKAVTVEISVDGRRLTAVLANQFRADVQTAGFGTGQYGFSVDLPEIGPAMSPHTLQIRVEGVDGELRGSPILLAATMELDCDAERSFTALLASPGSAAQLRRRLLFLTGQVDQMLDRIDEQEVQRRKRTIARGRKWRWRPEDGPEPSPAPLRALVIDETMPATGRDAGSNSILSHMQSLQRIGYDVSFVPADVKSTPFIEQLNERGITVHVSPWTGSVEELLRRQSGQFDLVYMHRLAAVMHYGKLVSTTMRNARRIYSVADLHHVRLLRQAEAEGPTPAAMRTRSTSANRNGRLPRTRMPCSRTRATRRICSPRRCLGRRWSSCPGIASASRCQADLLNVPTWPSSVASSTRPTGMPPSGSPVRSCRWFGRPIPALFVSWSAPIRRNTCGR